MFEKIAWARSEDERLRIRRDIEVLIIDELIQAIKHILVEGQLLPKSKFREALGYFARVDTASKELHTTWLCSLGQQRF